MRVIHILTTEKFVQTAQNTKLDVKCKAWVCRIHDEYYSKE
jgi:hypothetical protein